MLALILFSPLLGFICGCFFGWRLGFGVCFITTTSIFCSFINSLFLFYHILLTNSIYIITFGSWMSIDLLQVHWSFCIDSLTIIMLLVVTFISTLVHLYSTEYMEHDPHLPRFMSYLSLFTFFMLILVTANNFLQLFLGWEGVGLSSYLLINFWFTRIQANKAAIKAMLINRIGDFFLLFALFSIFLLFETLNYDIIFAMAPFFKDFFFNFGGYYFSALNSICFFLFLGAMGKSAQIGLHVWLPDAMEGPTPVSALIHAATMVTAGIFLIIRCSFIFEFAPEILKLIVYVGAFTAFFAASTGLFQNDIKKIIAYSTCSQLGYMIFACGLSTYDVALFHLSNHAFFKALLFLGSGSIIHAVFNEQDMRKLGGLRTLLPFSYSVILIGSLALIGFPFLTGFYSKDFILEAAFAKQKHYALFAYFLGSLSAFCTSFYSIRLLFMVFLSEPNGNKVIILNSHESSFRISISLFILSLLSIAIGYLSKDLFIGFGTSFWENAIFFLPESFNILDSEFIIYRYKVLPLLLAFLGGLTAVIIYLFNKNFFLYSKQNKYTLAFFNFLIKKWYFDKLYNQIIGLNVLNISYHFSYKDLDRGMLEFFGPFYIVQFFQFIIFSLNNWKSPFFFQSLIFTIIYSFFFSFQFQFMTSTNILITIFLIIAYFLIDED